MLSFFKKIFGSKPKNPSKNNSEGRAGRSSLLSIKSIFSSSKNLKENLDKLEEALLTADIGYATTEKIINKIKEAGLQKDISEEELKSLISEEVRAILQHVELASNNILDVNFKEQRIIMFTGVNGSGKTTSIGKLAYLYKKAGKKTIVAACDTFRAAAKEQLLEWNKKAGTEIIGAEKQGQDPASVAYKAAELFRNQQKEALFIDTAGRLQNNAGLMAELGKIKRSVQKIYPHKPDEVILVLDSTTGQNMLRQVEEFQKAVDITGLVITKFDGSSKAGAVVAVAEKFKLPIHILGVGEKIEDLKPFTADIFIDKLLG